MLAGHRRCNYDGEKGGRLVNKGVTQDKDKATEVKRRRFTAFTDELGFMIRWQGSKQSFDVLFTKITVNITVRTFCQNSLTLSN